MPKDEITSINTAVAVGIQSVRQVYEKNSTSTAGLPAIITTDSNFMPSAVNFWQYSTIDLIAGNSLEAEC
jgi:hypothetical protein